MLLYTKNHVHLKSGGNLPCGLVVWSTGLAPREFVTKLDIPKNDRGQVILILATINFPMLGDGY